MITCSKCKVAKPVHEFGSDKSQPTGRSYHCKQCKREAAAARYYANPDKHRARSLAYQQANKNAARAKNQAWRAKNVDARKAYQAQYRANNIEDITAAQAKWRAENPEKSRQASLTWYYANHERAKAAARARRNANKEQLIVDARDWRAANPGRVKATSAAWLRANRHVKAAISSRYRARKMKATPAWADHDHIKAFYESAAGISMLLGDWYEVDHIVPLQSHLVCGLHCEFNLQILHHKENASKGNRVWPDMP